MLTRSTKDLHYTFTRKGVWSGNKLLFRLPLLDAVLETKEKLRSFLDNRPRVYVLCEELGCTINKNTQTAPELKRNTLLI